MFYNYNISMIIYYEICLTLLIYFFSGGEIGQSYQRKRQFCIFCDCVIANLTRHLQVKHSNEDRVKAYINLPSKDSTRRHLLGKLRTEGYLKLNQGKEVLIRKGSTVEYIACTMCGAYFGKNTLHRHYAKCTGKKPPKNLISIAKGLKKVGGVSIVMTEALKTIVIPGMSSSGKVLDAIINDKDIVGFGNMQCIRFGDEIKKQKNLVRSRLRAVAKIRLAVTAIDSKVQSLIDIFRPDRWDHFVQAVHEYAHLETDDTDKQSPTNVQQIGLLMSNIAKDIKAGCPLDTEGKMERELIQSWIELYERKYKSTIGWQASKLATKKKWKTKKLLPLAGDIMKLNQYLKEKVTNSMLVLKHKYVQTAWEELNKATMLLLLSFNRKRIGEMMTITVEDYQKKEKIRENTDIYKGLTESEKMVASNYYHLTIRGKLIRPVPLLISVDIAEAIDLLLRYREEGGVAQTNKHLFAKKGEAFFDANIVFKEAAYACGAESPDDLTTTALRKHIATVSQVLNLTDTDLKVLSGFLGHTTRTHLEHYRLPSDAVHTARLSRLLSAFDSGTIHKFRGKAIEDIDIDVDIEDDLQLIPEHETSTSGPSISQSVERSESPVGEFNTDQPITPEKQTPASDYPLTPTPKKKRLRWNTPEKQAMKRYFSGHLARRTLPSLKECNSVRNKVSALRRRKVQVMKAWVSNQHKKRGEEKDV